MKVIHISRIKDRDINPRIKKYLIDAGAVFIRLNKDETIFRKDNPMAYRADELEESFTVTKSYKS